MHHLTTADKSFIVGDVVADLTMRYAALIARVGSGDIVRITAIGGDGDEVVATLLLNSGTVLAAETVHSSQPEPDNRAAEQYLRERISSLTDFRPDFPPEADDD